MCYALLPPRCMFCGDCDCCRIPRMKTTQKPSGPWRNEWPRTLFMFSLLNVLLQSESDGFFGMSPHSRTAFRLFFLLLLLQPDGYGNNQSSEGKTCRILERTKFWLSCCFRYVASV